MTHGEFWSRHYASILKKFEKIYCSSQIAYRKPEKEGFEWILHDLKISTRDLVFVDDLLENVQAARSLGITAIHYQNPAMGIREVRNILFDS